MSPLGARGPVAVFVWAIAAVLALGALVGAPAAATSYVMVDDGDLADQADLVVAGRVVASAVEVVEGWPTTLLEVEVERRLVGDTGRGEDGAGSRLTVQLPGGELADGSGLEVQGAPRLAVGDRALLFLVGRADGDWGVLHLGLGAFHRLETADGAIALRTLDEAREVIPANAAPEPDRHGPRRFDAFADWLADRALGVHRPADYHLGPDPIPAASKYALLTRGGRNIRWPDFDRDGTVSWHAHEAGQDGLDDGGTRALRASLAVWNDDPESRVRLRLVGTTSSTSGLTHGPDGLNTVLFDDPNDRISGTYLCPGGGTLAVAASFYGATHGFEGATYTDIVEAEVVMNDGVDCWIGLSICPDASAAEIFTHELGHTLGLGHSCAVQHCLTEEQNQAIMRASVHGDCRGAALSSDDRAGLRFLYAGGDEAPEEPEDPEEPQEPGEPVDPEDPPPPPPPRPEPIALALAPFDSQPVLRAPTLFQVVVTGPVESLALTTDDGGFAYAETPCERRQTPSGIETVFCLRHSFFEPGERRVVVTGRGAGQTAQIEQTVQVADEGTVPGVVYRSFVQSVLRGPRGDTGVYRSDLWLHNPFDTAVIARLTFVPRGAGDGAPEPVRLTVDFGHSVFIPDLLSTVFGLDRAQGSLLIDHIAVPIRPTFEPHVLVRTRSAVDVPGGGGASFGQLVPDEPSASWTADPRRIVGVRDGGGFLTTVSVSHLGAPGTPSGRVTLELVDRAGEPVGTPAVFGLAPGTTRLRPLAQLFPQAADAAGPFTLRLRSNGIPFTASATLLEVGSEDQVFLPARPVGQANALVVPRVVRGPGQFDVSFTSGLTVENSQATPLEVTLELLLRGQANRNPATATLGLGPGELHVTDDVLGELFGLAPGESSTGALVVRWPDGPAPEVHSLLLAETADGQRFGTRVGAVAVESASGRQVGFGAAQSELVRTSFGAVQLSAETSDLELVVRDGESREIARRTLSLAPGQHLERNLEGLFPGLGLGADWTVETTVLDGGPVLTYLAVIDASGDIFFASGHTSP